MGSMIGTKARRAGIAGAAGGGGGAAAKADDPLYVQIARTLKGEIVSGAYPVGSQLPTEDELCSRFSVSRYTVREALRRLRDAGLVSSRRGAGTMVAPLRASDSFVHQVMSINDLVIFATGSTFDIEAIRMVRIDDKLAVRSGLRAGEEWLEVCGLRRTEGGDAPICRTEYLIHRDYAAIGRLLQRHSGPIFPLIEDLFGLSVVEVEQEISAALIPPALAADLKVKPGAPALEVRRAYKTSEGQTAQVTINTHPASLFRHSMTMRRVRG
jgi:DNA-binding GntR family transcriptional regulator